MQMMGATLQMAFTGWRNVVEDGHRARQAAFKALYYWMNSRLRVGFDALRCVCKYALCHLQAMLTWS